MARLHSIRERLFCDFFDTIVDDGRGLPSRLRFFTGASLGTDQTNMHTPGAFGADQTALFLGVTVALMAERFNAAFGHQLQMAVVDTMIGAKTYGTRPVEGVPLVDAPHNQAALYRMAYGPPAPAGFFEEAKKRALREDTFASPMDPEHAAYMEEMQKYAPQLPARQNFSHELIPLNTFRDAWAAMPGPKALRMTLHVILTRDVQ